MKLMDQTLTACLRVWGNLLAARNRGSSDPSSREPGGGSGLAPGLSDDHHLYETVESGKRAQSVVYQTLWLQELMRRVVMHGPNLNDALGTSDSFVPIKSSNGPGYEELQERTRMLMKLLHATLKSFALEFNQFTSQLPGFEDLRISTVDVRDVKEERKVKHYGMVPKGATSRSAKFVTYIRCRASSPSWSLSIRGIQGRIEFFLVPAGELFLLTESETPGRLKTVLKLNDEIGTGIWTIDGLPADPDEMFYLMRGLFKNLVYASAQGSRDDMDNASMLANLQGEALRSTVRELLLTEQNMAQKIVSQQEEIQNRIARDLHDAVIADVMMLKRSLSGGDRPLSNEEIVDVLSHTAEKLREICHDLTPRDLRDWGLQTVVEALLERMAERTGADCSFECDRDLPELPYPVQLHLYRIIQECLNNAEKYSQATRIIVKFEVGDNLIRLSLRDNGKGFSKGEADPRKSKEGGSGLSGIKERTEMIRCFYPTRLQMESEPGKGSATLLEIRLGEGVSLSG